MRSISVFLLITVMAGIAAAQRPDDVLATATGHSFKVKDLSAETQKDVADMPTRIPEARKQVLDQLVGVKLLQAEAKAQNTTVNKLVASEKAKIKDPTEAEIKTVFDANQAQLAALSPEEGRKRVIAYLRNTPEQKAVGDLITQLKTKYKYAPGKDVNAVGIAPTDVVATVNGQPITSKDFEDYVRVPLFEARAELADVILEELHELIYDALVADEAKSLGIDQGALIGREVTDKMKEFSDAERVGLNDAFAKRLFSKYQVKFLYSAPEAPVENVSADDDPATGPANAPVTIIMFSDFQCSACSATHPLLQEAMAAYPGKIRFVVRDFPLESLHENAFLAARAAGAANLQGKFFEYIEILYKNQSALDVASLKKYAAQIGLNAQQFEVDFNSQKVADEIHKDMADGDVLGITGTPTIFVNGRRVRNNSVQDFKNAIDKALAK